MPEYRCLKNFWDGKVMHEVGSIVDYDKLPSANLEPLDAAGHAKREEAEMCFAAQRVEAALNANAAAKAAAHASAELVAQRLAQALEGFVLKAAPKAKTAAAE